MSADDFFRPAFIVALAAIGEDYMDLTGGVMGKGVAGCHLIRPTGV
jgi:hypothetical protein